jgi:hypothetical protein
MAGFFMANFDLTSLQQKIHRIVELNSDYPSAGTDEYVLRTGLINDHIDDWGTEEGILWNELWTLGSFASTSAASYALASLSPAISNVRFPGGFVELVDSNGASSYWGVIKLEEVRLRTNDQSNWCYFVGNPQAGFTIFFNPANFPGAGTIKFPYYKNATQLSGASDKAEMSDPSYIVHLVASDILSQDDPGESDKHLQIAQSRLRGMKTLNLMSAPWMSNRVQDRTGHLMGVGFGR